MVSVVKPISLKGAIALFAATAAYLSFTTDAKAQDATFEMRGLNAHITTEQVKANLPLLGSDCFSNSCEVSEEWMPSIGGQTVKRRKVNYSYSTGQLESIELIVEIDQYVSPDLNSTGRKVIREALTRHYGEPCEVVADDGMFGHVSWCFADGTLTETAWGDFESRVIFKPSTPEQRAMEKARMATLEANDF